MLAPLDENTLHDYLSAFADGELDPAQSLAVWGYLAEHPDRLTALNWLRELEQLTLASRRVLRKGAPAEVQARVQQLLVSPPGESLAPARANDAGSRAHVQRRWLRPILATAASVLLGMGIMYSMANRSDKPNAVPVQLVADVGRIHAECSRLPDEKHNATFQQIDGPLAKVVQADLGGQSATPDLSSIGFRLIGAGPCPAEKQHAVHLLYRAKDGFPAAISLFVQKDAGQFPALQTGHVYRVSADSSPFPMLAWRNGNAVYFLLADNEPLERQALAAMHPTPDDQIITLASR